MNPSTNLLKITFKFAIYLFSILIFDFLVSTPTQAQIGSKGIPLISNYGKNDYKAGRQNWDIIQDNNGFLYFANNSGILQFDGSLWKLIPVDNQSVVRSLAIDQAGTIFLGASDELGYLELDDKGAYYYQSLLPKIPLSHRGFREIWKIYPAEEGIYFASFSHLFLYRDNEMEVLLADEDIYFSYFINNHLYLRHNQKGLLRYDGYEFSQVSGGSQFVGEKEIWTMFPMSDDHVLIGTDKYGLYLMNEDTITPWTVDASAFLSKNQIFSGIRVSDSTFAFGTIQNGLVLIDEKGKITRHINKDKGLDNNTILSLFLDRDSILWMGLDNGIAAAQIHEPISIYGSGNGIYGAGYTSYIVDNQIYFGTNQGLFVNTETDLTNGTDNFKIIQGTEGQVWSLQQFDNYLICGHTKGAFLIDGEKAHQISDATGNWTFIAMQAMPNLLLSGTYDGLALYEIDNNGIKYKKHVAGFNESCRTLQEDTEGQIWMAHGYKGIFRINLNATKDSVLSYKLYTDEHGLPSKFGNELFEFRGAWGISTSEGIYTYHSESETFSKTYKYNELLLNLPVVQAKQSRGGEIWLLTDGRLSYLRPQEDSEYEHCTSTIGRFNQQLIPAFEHINFTNAGNLLISYDEGFIHYNTDKSSAQDENFEVFIRQIFVTRPDGDSLIYSGDQTNPNTKSLSLNHRDNALKFYFSSPYYKDIKTLSYSVKLDGLDNVWSQGQAEPFKEYTNLSPGNYTFYTKARNISGQESQATAYSFNIIPPWYLSKVAYSSYIILMVILFFLTIKLVIQKIEKDKIALQKKQAEELKQQEERYLNIKLKQEKEIVQLRNEKLRSEIQKQKQEAEVKNMELTSVTMQITHKNETLTNIREKIDKVADQVNADARRELRKLINTIEDDIKLDEDWERFKNHFELVHEAFFSRLQNQYPDLTPKDLKMCAYLRMNLTTKEISPLMNISIRSVENSRYRLRKKFDIDKDTNLVEFIMQV